MAIILDVELEGLPPTINHYYRTAKSTVRYKTPEGKAWQGATVAAMIRKRKRRTACSAAVSVTVEFTTPNRRRWDLDNRIKALQDCLAPAGIVEDDHQIEELHVSRRYGGTDDRTRVLVRTLPEGGKVAQISRTDGVKGGSSCQRANG